MSMKIAKGNEYINLFKITKINNQDYQIIKIVIARYLSE